MQYMGISEEREYQFNYWRLQHEEKFGEEKCKWKKCIHWKGKKQLFLPGEEN